MQDLRDSSVWAPFCIRLFHGNTHGCSRLPRNKGFARQSTIVRKTKKPKIGTERRCGGEATRATLELPVMHSRWESAVMTTALASSRTTLNIARPDTPFSELQDRLLDQGYLIIEELAVDLAQRTHTELSPHIENAPFGHDEFLGARTKRLGGILKKSSAARELVTHPVVLKLAESVLLKHATNYQLNFSGVMHLEPGAEAQPLHRDGDLYPLSHLDITTLMPTMWALSEFDSANGGTQVVPGSHLWPEER
ncbi:MAG: hypothetical protein EP301_02475, partial [Gammaproteobacteria bacterium]